MMFFYPSGSGDHKQQEEIKNAQKPEAGFSGGSTQHDASVFFSIFLEQTNKIQQQTLEWFPLCVSSNQKKAARPLKVRFVLDQSSVLPTSNLRSASVFNEGGATGGANWTDGWYDGEAECFLRGKLTFRKNVWMLEPFLFLLNETSF